MASDPGARRAPGCRRTATDRCRRGSRCAPGSGGSASSIRAARPRGGSLRAGQVGIRQILVAVDVEPPPPVQLVVTAESGSATGSCSPTPPTDPGVVGSFAGRPSTASMSARPRGPGTAPRCAGAPPIGASPIGPSHHPGHTTSTIEGGVSASWAGCTETISWKNGEKGRSGSIGASPRATAKRWNGSTVRSGRHGPPTSPGSKASPSTSRTRLRAYRRHRSSADAGGIGAPGLAAKVANHSASAGAWGGEPGREQGGPDVRRPLPQIVAQVSVGLLIAVKRPSSGRRIPDVRDASEEIRSPFRVGCDPGTEGGADDLDPDRRDRGATRRHRGLRALDPQPLGHRLRDHHRHPRQRGCGGGGGAGGVRLCVAGPRSAPGSGQVLVVVEGDRAQSGPRCPPRQDQAPRGGRRCAGTAGRSGPRCRGAPRSGAPGVRPVGRPRRPRRRPSRGPRAVLPPGAVGR